MGSSQSNVQKEVPQEAGPFEFNKALDNIKEFHRNNPGYDVHSSCDEDTNEQTLLFPLMAKLIYDIIESDEELYSNNSKQILKYNNDLTKIDTIELERDCLNILMIRSMVMKDNFLLYVRYNTGIKMILFAIAMSYKKQKEIIKVINNFRLVKFSVNNVYIDGDVMGG